MASTLGISPLLKPVECHNAKWLERDPVDVIEEQNLYSLFQELLDDKEVYTPPESYFNRDGNRCHRSSNGNYYCGQTLDCECCNGVCGPTYGCNCKACQLVAEELNEAEGDEVYKQFKEISAPEDHMEAWSWIDTPSLGDMKKFLKLAAYKQLTLFKNSVESDSFLNRLKSKIYVYSRFLSVYSRTSFNKTSKPEEGLMKQEGDETSVEEKVAMEISSADQLTKCGLAMMLKFTFKYLQKAWLEDHNVQLCSELLEEAKTMFQSITNVLLFNKDDHSHDLIDALSQMFTFLTKLLQSKEVIVKLSMKDKKNIVILLFELTFQCGSLPYMLQTLLLCLHLKDEGILQYLPMAKYIKKLAHQFLHTDYVPEILEMHYSEGGFNSRLSVELQHFVDGLDDDSEMNITELPGVLMKIIMCMIQPYKQTDTKIVGKSEDDLLVWGSLKLLSSLKEEKASIKVACIVCTDQLVVILTLDGKLLSCHPDNDQNLQSLQPYEKVSHLGIIQIACSYDGHFIGLAKENKIFTWFDNKDKFDSLTVIPLQVESNIVKVFAGHAYYAVLTRANELCIWVDDLNYPSTDDNIEYFPRTFEEFERGDVVDVAFSQYHNEVLIVTKGGKIWCLENNKLKLLVNEDLNIKKVYIAKYFYVALSNDGQVWRWGKDRFSKVYSNDKVYMQSVEKLNKENVLSISVGAYHCIALTQSYNVFCWGGLGGKEEEESLIREPVLLKALSEIGVTNIIAGPHQIFCWSVTCQKKLEKEIAFCVSICKQTFELLYELIAIATINETTIDLLESLLELLKLQFEVAKKFDVSPADLHFRDDLSTNFKDVIIKLVASSSSTISQLAEDILSSGWLYLLPTSEKRAKTLSDLLMANTDDEKHCFMLNLLVNCLIEKDGLEELLEDTFERIEGNIKNKAVSDTQDTLSILLKELFYSSTKYLLQPPASDVPVDDKKMALKILLKYQRLLFARVFLITDKDVCWPARCYVFEPTSAIKALLSMLNVYVTLLLSCCKQILGYRFATSMDPHMIMMSPVGVLFHEFIVFLIILQNYAPIIAINIDGIPQLAELLDLYDAFSKALVDLPTEADDGTTEADTDTEVLNEETNTLVGDEAPSRLNKDELTNKDGFANEDGLTKEEELTKEEIASLTNADISILEQFAGKEVSSALENVFNCNQSKELVRQNLNKSKVVIYTVADVRRVCIDSECMLSFFLGLHCCYLSHGMYASQDEVNNKVWITSALFKGGIVKQAVLKDRNLPEIKHALIDDMLSASPSYKSRIFVKYLYTQAELEGISIIPSLEKSDEALEKAMYYVIGVLLLHCGLEREAERIQDMLVAVGQLKHTLSVTCLNKPFIEVLKILLKIRTAILKRHQESSQPYDTVLCKYIMTNCKFLCTYLTPTLEYGDIKTRWFHLIHKLNKHGGYQWNVDRWFTTVNKQLRKYYQQQSIVMKDIFKFVMEESLNVDVLRKCFLMQVKRAKQRLISGYLMQSLCLRQHLYMKVQYSLQLGWLGMLVPGGLANNAKPGIMHNVELIPRDDVKRLQDVFKGFETFAMKEFFDQCDAIKNAASESRENNDQVAINNYVQRSGKYLLLSITLFCSSFMSGDIDFLIQCGVLERISFIMKLLVTNEEESSSSAPFIDEIKHRQTQLEELTGPTLVKLMKTGTRVVKGVDWKWDDQDGPVPSEGRVVSDIGDDGWVRVEWDSGSRNSYRMGKNGKYDLQIVDKENTLTKLNERLEKDLEEEGTNKGVDEVQSNFQHEKLVASLNWFIINTLIAATTTSHEISDVTLNHVTKFLIQIYKDLIENNATKWGSGIFGFLRSLCACPPIKHQITSNDWIDLMTKLYDLAFLKHDVNAGSGALFVKMQLIRQIFGMIKDKDMSSADAQWKVSFVKTIFKDLQSILTSASLFASDSTCKSSLKSSRTASVYTTIGDELIQFIRYLLLHEHWKELANKELWKRLHPSIKDNDIFMEKVVQLEFYTALCVMGGVDDRIRLGASVNHETYGRGVVKSILPNGKIIIQYELYFKARVSTLSQLNIIRNFEFDISSLLNYHHGLSVLSALLNNLLKFNKVNTTIAKGVNKSDIMAIKIYIASTRCLRLIFNNKQTLLQLIKYSSDEPLFYEVLKRSILSSHVQAGYDHQDLETAALSLSQAMSSNIEKGCQRNFLKTIEELHTSRDRKEDVVKHKIDDSSEHLVELLSAMGFPHHYIGYALKELGGNTRPEQLVSWLLEHPDVKVFDKTDVKQISNVFNDEDSCSSGDQINTFILASTVACSQHIEGVKKGDLGIILKILEREGSYLVYWIRLKLSLWLTEDQLNLVPQSLSSPLLSSCLQEACAVGSFIHLKHDFKLERINENEVGIVTQVNGDECSAYFLNNHTWSGNIDDVMKCQSQQFCVACRLKQDGGHLTKYGSMFVCDKCVQSHGVNNKPKKHDFIKYLKVSSNQYMAARMLNEEKDMAWTPLDDDPQPWIVLKLKSNTLITSLTFTMDKPGKQMCSIYSKATKSDDYVFMKSLDVDQAVTKLLPHQDEIYHSIKISLKNKSGDKSSIKVVNVKLTCVRRSDDYDDQIMALFINKKQDYLSESYLKANTEFLKCRASSKQVQVFCWGLNDKDQLGGLKGSKIKSAVVSDKLSALQCKDIFGGSKTLFCISRDDEVYACGESTNGRLGLGDVVGNVVVPRRLDALAGLRVRKLAVHPGGRHTLALTYTGELYSWGEGDDGKLGHGDKVNYEQPKLIELFRGMLVTDIACGSAHSAAVVNQSQLYTWGLGDYGRLGHGDEITHFEPTLVRGLEGVNVVSAACGSRDAQTVCLTDDGNVWSWGDGDFGKLGRGGSDGCFVPQVIEHLRDQGVCKLLCGAQFTLVMTTSGTVWTWGKGDFYRLGHGTDTHAREPTLVEHLKGKNIVDVAVGALHCLAVTEEGEIYAWGDNDHGQQGTGTVIVNKFPTRVLGTEEFRIKRVACGSSHSIAWAEKNPTSSILEEPVGFTSGKDPLGCTYINPDDFDDMNLERFMKEHRPSLTCSVLEISSKVKKTESLSRILQAINIQFSREFLLSVISCIHEGSIESFQGCHDNETVVKDLVFLLKLLLVRKRSESGLVLKYLSQLVSKKQHLDRMLMEVCMRELEDKIGEDVLLQQRYKCSVHESSHPYVSVLGGKLSGSVKYPGAVMLTVSFDEHCQTETGHDVLLFSDSTGKTLARRTGHLSVDWNKNVIVPGDELTWMFTTNSPCGLWGFRFTITPTPPCEDLNVDSIADEDMLKQPCLSLVKNLLGANIAKGVRSEETTLKLACLLSLCIQIKRIDVEEKKWMLDELHALLLSHNAPPIDVPMILNCSRYQDATVCKMRIDGNRNMKEAVLSSSLADFINGLPTTLLKQYQYEDVSLRQGDHLLFTPFLKSLALFACSLGLDTLPCCSNKPPWAWFQSYCSTVRTAQSFVQSTNLPKAFALSVREKIRENLQDDEQLSLQYEDHNLFSKVKDEQLLNWLNRRTQDWSIIWGGSGTIYGWGHNHRGQLAGIEGAKVKAPAVCDALATLKPVQIIGGEQTLFCVTADGKVYATGYGSSSRLGLGIQESINSPRMIESFQHITIKKVAVHSGGRHCLALSTDGEVYSWGEGDDGKLGHGNRISCNHPKLIESFRGKSIVDIACGGSHSAAVGEKGELYTWGKGRYGRLGHGDGEDQLRPKVVEQLQNYHVIDVACGSGDAQTLCITNNDAVWSWGDGDYGKLGRGGSDGCKIPMVIDYLTYKSVIKVECGSQFSMALTDYGILYTWGKGDYYRLGHGGEQHFRFPRNVLALEDKFVTSIACGSLHCVACTADGEVYCWGDNDEGQLGDSTTNAGRLPKLCTALQNKKIDRIACGSAHTLAWSTYNENKSSLPLQVPLEYNHLQDIPLNVLRDRAFLLHSFSKLFCSCIPMMELIAKQGSDQLIVNLLKGSILSYFKENYFRKIMDITMIRDRQHGPVFELNRVKKHRVLASTKTNASMSASKSVFAQLTAKLNEFPLDSFFLPYRNWKVKFIGESVDDCGGGFSESIAEMCDELQNGSLYLLMATPTNRDDENNSNDYFILNPKANTKKHKEMFKFFGVLLGIAIRCGNPLSLSLAEPMWKLLVGCELNIEDIKDIDRGYVSKYSYLLSLDNKLICDERLDATSLESKLISDDGQSRDPKDLLVELELPFSVRSVAGDDVILSTKHSFVTQENKEEYLKSSLQYKLGEFDEQIEWIRSGMANVVPVPLLSLFTGLELENMVCGNPDIPVESFQSITTYRGIQPSAPLVKWFWQTLEDFTNHERSLFLRFVWGRTRLPRTALDFKGKDFIFQVLDKYKPPDSYLPESYTCFFLLKLPKYTSFKILKEKLKYAIYFCKSIDSDDYARID